MFVRLFKTFWFSIYATQVSGTEEFSSGPGAHFWVQTHERTRILCLEVCSAVDVPVELAEAAAASKAVQALNERHPAWVRRKLEIGKKDVWRPRKRYRQRPESGCRKARNHGFLKGYKHSALEGLLLALEGLPK